MIVVPYTFQCKELLFVLGRMLPPPELAEPGTVTEAAAQLANTLLRNVVVVDDREVLVELDEPVEALAFARQLELRVERCIASPLALELLRESGQPARDTWAWLRKQIGITADTASGIVRVWGLGRQQLPAGVDQIPDGPGVLLWIVADPDRVVFVDRAQTIGRDGELAIADLLISPVHAAIVPYRGTWAIEDRASTGTYVDERQCTSRCLVPGMTLRLGAARLLVLSVR